MQEALPRAEQLGRGALNGERVCVDHNPPSPRAYPGRPHAKDKLVRGASTRKAAPQQEPCSVGQFAFVSAAFNGHANCPGKAGRWSPPELRTKPFPVADCGGGRERRQERSESFLTYRGGDTTRNCRRTASRPGEGAVRSGKRPRIAADAHGMQCNQCRHRSVQ